MIELKQKYGENEVVCIVDEKGAQIVSIVFIDNVTGSRIELMHDGAQNPNTNWSGTAKNLFPNPGPVLPSSLEEMTESQAKVIEKLNAESGKEKIYTFRGGLFKMNQHGFANDSIFQVQSLKQNYAVLSLRDGPETYGKYPFKFAYYVIPELLDESVGILYETRVVNLDSKPIVAGMGWHPAFQLHHGKDNYYVELTDSTGKVQKFKASEIIDGGKGVCVELVSSVRAVVFYNDPETNQSIEYLNMETDAKNIVLWGKDGKTGNDFLCVEPWDTTPGQIGRLSNKSMMSSVNIEELKLGGASVLQPKEQLLLSTKIIINCEYFKTLDIQSER